MLVDLEKRLTACRIKESNNKKDIEFVHDSKRINAEEKHELPDKELERGKSFAEDKSTDSTIAQGKTDRDKGSDIGAKENVEIMQSQDKKTKRQEIAIKLVKI